MGHCARCNREGPTEPWKDPPWKGRELCGPCKVYLTLSRKGFARRLAEGFRQDGHTAVVFDVRPGRDPAEGN